METSVRIVSFEASPIGSTSAGSWVTGAHVNVYLMAGDDEGAVSEALREAKAAGWVVASECSVTEVGAHSFAAGSEGLAHYKQCLTDGVVVVVHTWRHEH